MSENKFNIEKFRNVVFHYKIPCSLDLKDSFGKDDLGQPFIVGIDKVPAKIHFKRVYDFRYKDSISIAPFSKMDEDRNGILSYTEVQVWFDKQAIKYHDIDVNRLRILPDDKLVDVSLDYLNKLINQYKLITESYWLRNIVRKDLFDINVVLIDTDENQERIIIAIPKHHEVQFNGGKEISIPDSQEQTLRKLIVQDDLYDYEQMRLTIKNFFSLNNFNVALVLAVTEFEHFIYDFLKKNLSNTKLDKIKKKESCGCMAGISEVCENGFKKEFNIDFGTTTEFKDVKEDAFKLRNLIVHGERLNEITYEECQRAIDSLNKAKKFIYENIILKSAN